MADIDNIGDKGLIFLFQFWVFGEKTSVQLQAVKIQLLPYVYTGVPGTKIID